MEDPSKALGSWETLGVVHGFAGLEMLEPGQKPPVQEGRVLGIGSLVHAVRDLVRKSTGGWWVGPRMAPRIRIMKRVKGT